MIPTATEQPTATSTAMTLQEAGILVRLDFGKFFPKRKNNKAVNEYATNHQTDRAMHSAHTLCIPEEFIADIVSFEGETRNWFYHVTHPWERKGSALLPAPMINEFMAEIAKRKRKHEELVDGFVSKYDHIVEEAKARLNGDFNPANYPSPEHIRSRFLMEVSFTPIPSSGDYRFEVVEEIKKDTERILEARYEDARKNLRERLVERLEHLAERCDAKSQNSRSHFAETNITHLVDLIDLIPKMLLGEDADLVAAVEDARKMLEGVDADIIKDSDRTRDAVAKRAREIANSLAL